MIKKTVSAILLLASNLVLSAPCPTSNLPKTLSDFEQFTGAFCSIAQVQYKAETLDFSGSLLSLNSPSCNNQNVNNGLVIESAGKISRYRICQLTDKLAVLEDKLLSRGVSLYSELENNPLDNIVDPIDWLTLPNENLLATIFVSLANHQDADTLISQFLIEPLLLAQTSITLTLNASQQKIITINGDVNQTIQLGVSEFVALIHDVESKLLAQGRSFNILSAQVRNSTQIQVSHALALIKQSQAIINDGPYEFLTQITQATLSGIQLNQAYWEALLIYPLDFSDVRIELVVNPQNIKQIVISRLNSQTGQFVESSNVALSSLLTTVQTLQSQLEALGFSLLNNAQSQLTQITVIDLKALLSNQATFASQMLARYTAQLNELTEVQVVNLINNAVVLAGYAVTVGDAYFDEALGRTVRMVTLVSDAQQTAQYELSNLVVILNQLEFTLNKFERTISNQVNDELVAVRSNVLMVIFDHEVIVKEVLMEAFVSATTDINALAEKFSLKEYVFNNQCLQFIGDNVAGYTLHTYGFDASSNICGNKVQATIDFSAYYNYLKAMEATLNRLGLTLKKSAQQQYQYAQSLLNIDFLINEAQLEQYQQQLLAEAMRLVELNEENLRTILTEGVMVSDVRVYLDSSDQIKTDPADAFDGLDLSLSQYQQLLSSAEQYLRTMGYSLQADLDGYIYLAELKLENLFNEPEQLIAQISHLLNKNVNVNVALGPCDFSGGLPTTELALINLLSESCNANGYLYSLTDYVEAQASVLSCEGEITGQGKVLRITYGGAVRYEASTCYLSNKLTNLHNALEIRGMILLSDIRDPLDWLSKPNDELLAAAFLSLFNIQDVADAEAKIVNFLQEPLRVGLATISLVMIETENIIRVQQDIDDYVEYSITELISVVTSIESELQSLGQSIDIQKSLIENDARSLMVQKVSEAQKILVDGPVKYLTNLVLGTLKGIEVNQAYWANLLENKLDFGNVSVELSDDQQQLIIETSEGITNISFVAFLSSLQEFENNLNILGYSLRNDAAAHLIALNNIDIRALLTDQTEFVNQVLIDINGRFRMTDETLIAYLHNGIVFGGLKVQIPDLNLPQIEFSNLIYETPAVVPVWRVNVNLTVDLSVFLQQVETLELFIHDFGYSLIPNLEQYKVLPDVTFAEIVSDPTAVVTKLSTKYASSLETIAEQEILDLIGSGLAINGYAIAVTIPQFDASYNRTIRKLRVIDEAGEVVEYELEQLVIQLQRMEESLNVFGKTLIDKATDEAGNQLYAVRDNIAQVLADKEKLLKEILIDALIMAVADLDVIAHQLSSKRYFFNDTCLQVIGDSAASYQLRSYGFDAETNVCGTQFKTNIKLSSYAAAIAEVEVTLNSLGLTLRKSAELEYQYIKTILNYGLVINESEIEQLTAQLMAEVIRYVQPTAENLNILLSQGILVGGVRVYIEDDSLKAQPADALNVDATLDQLYIVLEAAEIYLNKAKFTLQKNHNLGYTYLADLTLADLFLSPENLLQKIALQVAVNVDIGEIKNTTDALRVVTDIADAYGYSMQQVGDVYRLVRPDGNYLDVDLNDFKDSYYAIEAGVNEAGYTLDSAKQASYTLVTDIKIELLLEPSRVDEFVRDLVYEQGIKTLEDYSPITIVPSAMPAIKTVPLSLADIELMFESSGVLESNNRHCPMLNNYAGSYYLGGGTTDYFAYLIKQGSGANFRLIPIEGDNQSCQMISKEPMSVQALLSSFNEMERELNQYGFTLYEDKSSDTLRYVEDLDVWELFLNPEEVINSLLRDLGTQIEKIAKDSVEEVQQQALNAVLGEECSQKPDIDLVNIDESFRDKSTQIMLLGKETTVGALTGFIENSIMAMCALGVDFDQLDSDVSRALGDAKLVVSKTDQKLTIAINQTIDDLVELENWAKNVESALNEYAAESLGLDPDDLAMIMMFTDRDLLEDALEDYAGNLLEGAVGEYMGHAGAKLAELEAYYLELEGSVSSLIPDIPDLPSPVAPKYPELKMQKIKEWTGLEYGNKKYMGTEAHASYELRGSKTAQAATAEFDVLVHIFGDGLSLAGGYVSGKAATDSIFYTHKLRILGYDVGDKTVERANAYRYEERASAMSVKVEVSATFMVGPVPVTLTAGAKGSAGYAMAFGLTPLKIYGELGPSASAHAYASASAGIRGLLSVGAEAQLLIMRADMPLRGEVGLIFDEEGMPYINMNLVGELRVRTLSGRVFAYVEYLKPRAGLPPWKRKKAKKDLVKWKGQTFNTRFMSWGLTLGHTSIKTRGDVLDQNDISEFAVFENVTSRFARYNKLLAYQADTNTKTQQLFAELNVLMQSDIQKAIYSTANSVEVLNNDVRNLYRGMLSALSTQGFLAYDGEPGIEFDQDNDGITDSIENALGMNSNSLDSDGDGLLDAYEWEHNLDPTSRKDGNTDSDGDGISDKLELEWGTDPLIKDGKYIASWLIPILSILY